MSLAGLRAGVSCAPPVEQVIEGPREGAPRMGGLVKSDSAAIVESVVLPVWARVRRHDVRLECTGLIQPAQGPVHRGIANAVQPAFAQLSENVIAVAVAISENGQNCKVQNSFEELARIARIAVRLHAAVQRVLRIAY